MIRSLGWPQGISHSGRARVHLASPCLPWMCHWIRPNSLTKRPTLETSCDFFAGLNYLVLIKEKRQINKNLQFYITSQICYDWHYFMPRCSLQFQRAWAVCSIALSPFMKVFWGPLWHRFSFIPQSCKPQPQFLVSQYTHCTSLSALLLTHAYIPPSRDSRGVTSAWCVESGPH